METREKIAKVIEQETGLKNPKFLLSAFDEEHTQGAILLLGNVETVKKTLTALALEMPEAIYRMLSATEEELDRDDHDIFIRLVRSELAKDFLAGSEGEGIEIALRTIKKV